MKFPTALILISGLTAGVLAAPFQNPATGSMDATDPPPVGLISGALPGVHLPPPFGERALSSEQKTTTSSMEQRRGIAGPVEGVVCDDLGVCI
ncbi:hypothetical protein BO86DRAFT_398241 [Aspergillus japonicus CBS 114.51]|uniref:Uncharacterized protein n=2 Tax=Aspergillus TaxID=5052 RepID=A0A2V5ICX2_ASPV1|nr:hypothetical protein BO86DRAFT_398241 [Aspergillus japonicus CBS 114.51]PYI21847.1 hypothetical protein BO99DRAFT_430348 [Aspergillus violaceofuscus CBS 115571]RAH83205.1 hypothetical protein BO86DRAFT_398241 [Aspergillus japonicus CBS 114.51]